MAGLMMYQKSEQCWCGETINAEGTSEATVLIICEAFRAAHRHRQGETHIRGMMKTACGLDLWMVNGKGDMVTAVDSVGGPFIPDHPVTCGACIDAWNSFRDKKIGDEGPMGFDPRQRKYDDQGVGTMVPKEIGRLTIPLYTGEPSRITHQYAIEVQLGPLHKDLIKNEGFDWALCGPDTDDAAVWGNYDEAENTRRKVELTYERLGVPVVTVLKHRSVRTYVDSWEDLPQPTSEDALT